MNRNLADFMIFERNILISTVLSKFWQFAGIIQSICKGKFCLEAITYNISYLVPSCNLGGFGAKLVELCEFEGGITQ